MAERIETMVAEYDGRRIGPRTRRDGVGGGLRVDFTFDDATPAIALEITSLAVPQVMALGAELIKLEGDVLASWFPSANQRIDRGQLYARQLG